jgi:3',5'-cyclic AMP phosphodiesterase CpdA
MQPTVLFHASDLHFGYEDREALAWFLAEVERERPAAVLCTGDLTMRGSAREYDLAKDWLGALPVPLVLVAGNHDVPYYHHMVRRLARPYQRFRDLETAVGARLDLPDIAVVPLKTVARAQWRLNWSKGRVSNGDLDAALHGLGVEADKALKLVVCHHPLVDAGTQGSGSTRGGARALAALARAGADAVLSGHVHDSFDLAAKADGLPVRLIGAGTLSQRLRATPPGYNRLEWSPAGGLRVVHRSFA